MAPLIATWNLVLFKIETAVPNLLIIDVAAPTTACIPIYLANYCQLSPGYDIVLINPPIPADVSAPPKTNPTPGIIKHKKPVIVTPTDVKICQKLYDF